MTANESLSRSGTKMNEKKTRGKYDYDDLFRDET